GVDRSAPQPDDHRQMLDPDGTLEFAAAARRALERSLFRDMLAEQGSFVTGSELVQVRTKSKNDFLGIEHLAGICRRTVLGAPSAFHAGVRLESVDARDILARIEPEVLVTLERRDPAEARSTQEHRQRTQDQVQVLGMRDQRKKSEEGERMQPPVDM